MHDIEAFDLSYVVPSCLHIVDRYCDNNWCVRAGKYNFHNFMFIVSGEGRSITDGKEYKMSPGMLVYHYPGQSFGYETSHANYMHCYGINFLISIVTYDEQAGYIIKPVEKLPFDNFAQMVDIDILVKYFSNLANVWTEAKRNYQLKCRSIFSNILYEISNQFMYKHGYAELILNIESATSYIHKNFNKNLTLESLAALTGLNQNYFGSIFKRYTGMTPVEYINFTRVSKSEEYLSIGCSVNETARLVGFNDQFYFSRVFKKIKGVSPKDFSRSPLRFL